MAADPLQHWRKPIGESLHDELRNWRWDVPTPISKVLGKPKSVTFPICAFCRNVIWNFPHYEEEVGECLCDDCARKEIEQQEQF